MRYIIYLSVNDREEDWKGGINGRPKLEQQSIIKTVAANCLYWPVIRDAKGESLSRLVP